LWTGVYLLFQQEFSFSRELEIKTRPSAGVFSREESKYFTVEESNKSFFLQRICSQKELVDAHTDIRRGSRDNRHDAGISVSPSRDGAREALGIGDSFKRSDSAGE